MRARLRQRSRRQLLAQTDLRPCSHKHWRPSSHPHSDAPPHPHPGRESRSRSRQVGEQYADNFGIKRIYAQPMTQMLAMGAFIGGGVLERHPKLKVAFLEANCSWVPWLSCEAGTPLSDITSEPMMRRTRA